MNIKYIFVTGGVVSGLGKGITAASLGRLLKERGYKVTILKFDPYINVDPGTMSPYQHGEVFVTDDGAETDLDIGHYERFIDENLSVNSNITAGKIYWNVLNKERQGDYLGSTIQVIPHITNEIKDKIYKLNLCDPDVNIIIIEIGGTVGDIESLPFLESIRQFSVEVGKENSIFIHVTLVPFISGSNELKSKPTQHSVKELLSLGIQPNIIVCRSDTKISEDMKQKLSLFCNVRKEDIIQNFTSDVLYEVPLILENEGLANSVCHHLKIENPSPNLTEWKNIVTKLKNSDNSITIGIVGKYIELPDAYISIIESLKHAGPQTNTHVNIKWINSSDIIDAEAAQTMLSSCCGILVPGGFGDRGIEGMINAIKFARTNNIPYLGICLGMQLAVIEFARNILGLQDATSSEFQETENNVIHLSSDKREISHKGGTMRLGLYPCKISKSSKLFSLYNQEIIHERHRHRYEFNNKYREAFQQNGMNFSGLSIDEKSVKSIEIPTHKWFIGVQYHPEFKSRPNKPHPLFLGFIRTCLK